MCVTRLQRSVSLHRVSQNIAMHHAQMQGQPGSPQAKLGRSLKGAQLSTVYLLDVIYVSARSNRSVALARAKKTPGKSPRCAYISHCTFPLAAYKSTTSRQPSRQLSRSRYSGIHLSLQSDLMTHHVLACKSYTRNIAHHDT